MADVTDAIEAAKRILERVGNWHGADAEMVARALLETDSVLKQTFESGTFFLDRAEKAKAELEKSNLEYNNLYTAYHHERKQVAALREALEDLMSWQNGPPLLTYDPPYVAEGKGWSAAMKRANLALGPQA